MGSPDGPVFFFADAHLTTRRTPVEIARSRRLDSFLAHVRDRASALYILGDLFDFWFEYRHAIPSGHLWLFRRFCEIRDAGVPTTFLSGNHDYWCLDFLAREFGFDTHDGPVDAVLQGRRIWMAHGDGLIKKDWGYRALRRVLRNPLAISAYRLIHPDIGVPLAHRSSGTSRLYTEQRDPGIDQYYEEVARPRFAAGYDVVMLAHVHIPTHRRENGHDFLLLGDWVKQFTYATLQDGTVHHDRWPG